MDDGGVDNLAFHLVRSLDSLLMRVVRDGLFMVDDLVVERELAGTAIVVVHLEDKVAILDIDLAGHEEGRVILEAPVVTGIPLLLIPFVEVISPAKLEVF